MSNLIAPPQTLSDFIFGNDNTRDELENILADANYFPAHSVCGLLFHGPNGSGKTTLANWLPKQLERRHDPQAGECWIDSVPCIGEPSAKVIQYTLKNMTEKAKYAWQRSGLDYIHLDDVDCLSPGAMKALRGYMTTTGNHSIYLMTANHIGDVDKGVRDRSLVLEMPKPTDDQWLAFAQPILRKQGVVVSDADLAFVLNLCDGSWRRVMGALEKIIANARKNGTAVNIQPYLSPTLTTNAVMMRPPSASSILPDKQA